MPCQYQKGTTWEIQVKLKKIINLFRNALQHFSLDVIFCILTHRGIMA